jgi:hypothetical protein
MRKLIFCLLSLVLFQFSNLVYSQCSTSNAGACSCPGGGTNCILLPDITAGKVSLNATTGWTEFPQSAGNPNKGLLRIDVSTPNIGWGPLETIPTDNYLCGTDTLFNFVPPASFLCPDGSFPRRMIKQRLFEKNGNSFNFIERDAGWMVAHPSHGHIHIDGWGLYTIRLRNAALTDTLQWPIVNSGVKVSFCLIDLTTCTGSGGDCVDANGTVLYNNNFPNYGLGGGYACNNIKQGISVGKVDIYHQYLDESFVKIPYEACNGEYHVVVQVDPDNHFQEMRDDNNWLAAKTVLTQQRTNGIPYAYIFSPKGNTVCEGSSIPLTASGASSYVWSTGATTQTISVNQAGKYWVRATTPCGTTTSDTLNIAVSGTSAFPSITKEDTVCIGERAQLYASGNAHWYDAPTGGNLVFIGNNYETGTLLASATYYVADQPSVLAGRLGPISTSFSGNGNYTGSRGEYLIFNAFLPFKLKTIKLDASTAGIRTIQLRDQYGKVLQQKNINLAVGQQTVLLDFFVPSGLNHQLGLASSSPSAALYRSTTGSANIGFPFALKSVGNIVGSSSGDVSYPYFYDWDVEVTSVACNIGSRKAVTAHAKAQPMVMLSGVQPVYDHHASVVQLTGVPAGGVFSGNGVLGDKFYPRIAGLGSHIITYTVDNGTCVSEDAKQTMVLMNENLLQDGYSVQLFNHPGPNPVLWVVTRESADLEISLLGNNGQLIKTWLNAVNPGTNFITLDVSMYPKSVYMLQVKHSGTGGVKALKLLN